MASIVCAQQRQKERKAANCFLNCCGFLSLGHSRTHEKADSFLYGCLSLETLNWRRWAPSRALFDFHLPDSLSNQPSHANDLKRMYVSFPFGNWRPLFFPSLFLCVVYGWKQNKMDVMSLKSITFNVRFVSPFMTVDVLRSFEEERKEGQPFSSLQWER